VFQIKICGVKSATDATAIGSCGIDAIGLNFYAESPRFVADADLDAVAAAVPEDVARVGVFVNSSRSKIESTIARARLDFTQLHGDEPPDLIADLPPRSVIRALRIRDGSLEPVVRYLADCERIGAEPCAVLLDAYREGSYGGTGQPLRWEQLRDWRRQIRCPLVLAGGLTPANVAEAIGIVKPSAVDTASGVECDPGVKDVEASRDFATFARQALDAAGGDARDT
jgi:phosphoribosylanthranilate isomerase